MLGLGNARAAELGPEPVSPPDYPEVDLRRFAESLADLNGPTAFSIATAGGPRTAEESGCVRAYSRVFRKPTFEVRIFLGYFDHSFYEAGTKHTDWVADPYMQWHLASLLTQVCEGATAACGFHVTETGDGRTVLERAAPRPGQPDASARVTLENAAVSESDHRNRGELSREQHARSARIGKDFLASLSEADIVLYNGHARRGTGPGWKPVPPVSWTGLKTFVFRPSLHAMQNALQASRTPPALLGYFACSVDHYYENQFQRAQPTTALVFPPTIKTPGEKDAVAAPSDNLISLLGTLNSLLGGRCAGDFKKSLLLSELKGLF